MVKGGWGNLGVDVHMASFSVCVSDLSDYMS